uniref:Protein kinase domain-containing protein n=1 Tax=Panagrolaimus sp. JU765 TaxID=591449 RepID=A0AC34QLH4_9BILA
MDDQNDDAGPDVASALSKARKQAQINATKDKNNNTKNIKKGAILHVNNYRSGVPEGKYNASKNPNFPTSLKVGYMIKTKPQPTSNELCMVVEAKLSERVYMVRNMKTDKFFSMKIEPFHNSGNVKQLRRDVLILIDAIKQDSRFTNHFMKIISKGRIPEQFNYIITSLCDFNLDDLREKIIKGDFSLQTAARLSMQAFQAVHDLHTLGYLHRNISPSAFMLGLENNTLIYMGSLSTAHFYKSKNGKENSSPKKLLRMHKTRFLPRVYHRYKEMNRFDDLESWLYTSIDFFGRKLLPWFDNMDESQIVANKERFFFDAFEEIFTYAPKQLQVLQRYIDKNNDDDKPNYTFMGITLVGMRDKLKFPYQGPFDFQVSSTNTSSKAKKIGKKLKKNASQEIDKFPDDGGPAIKDTSHQVKKKKKKEPSLMNNVNEEQVFEDGEAEVPTNMANGGDDGKPGLNPERALSLARKKKTGMNAAAKAAQAEMDEGTNAPLKPVKNEGLKNAKKKKKLSTPAPEENNEEEKEKEDEEEVPQPPPKKKVIPKKKKKPGQVPSVQASPASANQITDKDNVASAMNTPSAAIEPPKIEQQATVKAEIQHDKADGNKNDEKEEGEEEKKEEGIVVADADKDKNPKDEPKNDL